jgi:hypothetical protein
VNIAHMIQRVAGCHMTSCATHHGGLCDCGAAPVRMANSDEVPAQEHDALADENIDEKGPI